MASNRELNGLKPVAYYQESWWRLDWRPVGGINGDREYWEMWYRGKHVGDFFEGKARWYAVIFGRTSIWGPYKNDILRMATGLIVGPRV